MADGSTERNDGDQLGSVKDKSSIVITETMVANQINRLADNKAAGTNGLGSSFVKKLVGMIEMPLVLIFQESLRSGQLPVQWQEANVTAIIKKEQYIGVSRVTIGRSV